ncbi:uncharacterized protein LOC131219014 [Magnolia sinica]|uniref:uncharacterized protein LOC131219014 n=1 Tax=Magnolia sinica TaxID=86752 RepID=UPI0026594BB8|nr:uncharacterized protein LOC131219014 [Magnolia sinica]
MTTNFDRWEKDPFFSAAEEVQESADRMESAYRRWLHGQRNSSMRLAGSDELRRELQTTLGTTKWQLEEFERAVRLSYSNPSADDARSRHRHFVAAIEHHISTIVESLRDSVAAEGGTSLPWVRLDEGERDELAAFLVGPVMDGEIGAGVVGRKDGDLVGMEPGCSTNSCRLGELGLEEKRERAHGHRRTASAGADMESWSIAVPVEVDRQGSLNGRADLPPPRIMSFSGIMGSMESSYKLTWPKNGFRKWKGGDRHHAVEIEPLRAHQLSRGIDGCYEKSKSCLDGCDESFNKPLYGWVGALQRQFQRSQYQFQYSRPIQMTFWVVLIICLIGCCIFCGQL